MTIIPIVFSAISLLLSLFTLWVNRYSKFKLEVVSTSRINLTKNPHSLGAKHPAIVLQLLFTNKGAQLGYVNDIAISLKNRDSKNQSIVFRSLYEQIEDTLNFTDQLPPPKLTAFLSFPIKSGETVAKKIWFVPAQFEEVVKFEEKKYIITPYTSDTTSKGWNIWEEIQVDINKEDLQEINKTTATPTAGGGQFVKLMVHSKPTVKAEEMLKALETKLAAPKKN
ncbi:MAG: hypothetical protein HY869_04890 [Chloroflexi bacterium]|nr:hypothetical protein [Chloroflexota bacterium]